MLKFPSCIVIDQHLQLRALQESDAEAIFHLVDSNRLHLRAWLPWVDTTQTVEDERAYLRMVRSHINEQKNYACSIWYKDEIAGTIGFHPFDWANRKVEIGYWLGAQFQGHGIMTKACETFVHFAFQELKLNKVEIRCATGNHRSSAIPTRLGFTHEGTIRAGEWLYDHFVDLKLYGMLASEWQNSSNP